MTLALTLLCKRSKVLERAFETTGLFAPHSPIKRSVVTGAEIPFAEALGLERELQQLLFTSEYAEEGLTACAEKRAASSKGK